MGSYGLLNSILNMHMHKEVLVFFNEFKEVLVKTYSDCIVIIEVKVLGYRFTFHRLS
jgi:hypothetical protein